jgi:magnesium transporter
MTAVGKDRSEAGPSRGEPAVPQSAPPSTDASPPRHRPVQPAEHGQLDGRLRVRRFDADRRDRVITLEAAIASEPTSRQLLWIDVRGDMDAADLEKIVDRFELDADTRRALAEPHDHPSLAVYGSYFHMSLAADPGGRDETPSWLHIVASQAVVITQHDGELRLLEEVDNRIKSDATLGSAEGAEFVGLLLDEVITSYFAAVDEIEDAVDELDGRALLDRGEAPVLRDLVGLRRRISRLRRLLSGHRSTFAAVSGPEIRQLVTKPDAFADVVAVTKRFESAVAAVESSRDALLGSFDVYMTRTAQRTNEVMKVLTIATVLLLPGSVIAGLLGMNVVVPLNKDDPMSFWLVVIGFLVLIGAVLGVAKRKGWI